MEPGNWAAPDGALMIVSGIFLQTEGSSGAGGLGNHVASLQRSAPSVESMFAEDFKLRRSAPSVEPLPR